MNEIFQLKGKTEKISDKEGSSNQIVLSNTAGYFNRWNSASSREHKKQ